MEKERKVSVKLEAKDEVPLLPVTRASRNAAMKSEETVCVKCEATNEILNVSETKIADLVQPGCQLCSCTGCDATDFFALETKASDIGADALVPIVRIKKEPDDTSDEKIVTNLLGASKFGNHTKGGGGGGEEEEKEMIAGLITEADENATDLLLSNTTIKKEPEDTKDSQAMEDLLGFCRLCDLEDKTLALALQPVFSDVEESTKPIFGNSRSMRNAVSSGSDVCGAATTHRDHKRTTVEAVRCTTGVLDADRSVGGKDCAGAGGVGGGTADPGEAPSKTRPSLGGAEKSRRKTRSDDCGKPSEYTFPSGVPQNLSTPNHLHTCYTCHKSFPCPSDLKRHTTSHSEKKPFKCVDCGKCFKRAEHVRRHAVSHSEKQPYMCDKCGRSFKLVSAFQKHGLVHTDERSYTCGDCGKTFKSRGCLLTHTRSHIGQKPYECDVCGATFTRSHSLTEHRRRHFGERPFECEMCGATFRRAGTLRDHVKTHTREKPYKCNICGATFSNASRYSRHKQCSSAEIPPKCPDCRSISEFDNLLEQLLVVQAEKSSHQCVDCGTYFTRDFKFKTPLECDYCGKCFCIIIGIRKHALVHRIKSSFKCANCGITYKRRDHLKRHQMKGPCKSYYRDKPFGRVNPSIKKSYECVDCGNTYTRRDNLKRHEMTGLCKANCSDKSSSRVDVVKGRRKICTVKV